MKKVYLDNGSTSYPKAPGVGEAMSNFIINVGCNIGRGGYESAYNLGEKIYETRAMLADMFNFDKISNVVFTPSVTYSLNFVIKGFLKKGDHVLISSMEHNSVARSCEALKGEGVEVTVCPCNIDGTINVEQFKKSFRQNTKMVVMSHASNVCGTILDAEKIGEICKKNKAKFVLDAAQSAGVIDIDFERFNLSALCVTGHKGLLGPQGIGALLISDEMAEAIVPVIDGGTGSESHLLTMPKFMPDRFEAGTLNLPGIIGLNTSLNYIKSIGIENIYEHERQLVDYFISKLKDIPEIRIVGLPDSKGRVGTVSLDFGTMDNAEVAYVLDSNFGIMTRCGLHCAPLAHQTLETYPQGTVRFAFGYKTTREEIDYAINAIKFVI